MILRPSSSASTDRSCIACMYPQHTSAFLVNGIRICFPAPVLARTRVRQSSARSRALPIACAVTGITATTISQIRTKARVIFACQTDLRSTVNLSFQDTCGQERVYPRAKRNVGNDSASQKNPRLDPGKLSTAELHRQDRHNGTPLDPAPPQALFQEFLQWQYIR